MRSKFNWHPEPIVAFWNNTEILGEDDCWNWKGFCERKGGIPRFGDNCKSFRAQTWIYRYFHPGDDRHAYSHCGNKLCVNPTHISIGGGPRKKYTKHGATATKAYSVWEGMLERCRNPKAAEYFRYGGRGIKVCERWASDFNNFLNDMGEKPEHRSLDRIDSNGNYEPGNCRWATTEQQNRNKRSNKYVTFAGRTMIIADWAREIGMARNNLGRRLKLMPVELAMTLPKGARKWVP